VRSAGFQDPPEVGEAKSWLGPQDSNLDSRGNSTSEVPHADHERWRSSPASPASTDLNLCADYHAAKKTPEETPE
jgi:hypothetical protein